jgi:L-alanine-DL-glutamate epimerase-like enolase superfamily enzyme
VALILGSIPDAPGLGIKIDGDVVKRFGRRV